MEQPKKRNSILNKHEQEILEALSKRKPYYIIAKKYNVHVISLHYWIKQRNRMEKVLFLMSGVPNIKYIRVTEAFKILKEKGLTTSWKTIIRWVEKNKIGFQPGGSNSTWWIDYEKFLKLFNISNQEGEE